MLSKKYIYGAGKNDLNKNFISWEECNIMQSKWTTTMMYSIYKKGEFTTMVEFNTWNRNKA
jgi:hypothetical protein